MSEHQKGIKSHVLESDPRTVRSLFGDIDLLPMTFKSGKVGYRTNTQLDLKCGPRTYKCASAINVVAIDSAKSPLSDENRQAILEGGPVSLKDLGVSSMEASPRSFQKGSVGFYAGDKREVKLPNGNRQRFQVNVLVTANHSAEWAAQEEQPDAEADTAQQ